jgi:hypothetical protein
VKRSASTVGSLVNWKLVSISLLIGALGLTLLVLQEFAPYIRARPLLAAPLRELGALLVASVAISAIWELFLRREFRQEILEAVGLSSNLETAGVTSVLDSFYDDVPWNDLFSTARELDIVVSYGRTWRRIYLSRLQECVTRSNFRLRVLIADPEDDHVRDELCHRYSMSERELLGAITDALRDYYELRAQAENGATVEILLAKRNLTWSVYRFGEKSVFSFYNHGLEKGISPVMLLRRPGRLVSYIDRELQPFFAAQEGYSRRV